MIKNLIDKLLGKPAGGHKRFGKREEVAQDVHRIDPALVDRRAVDVVTTLQDAGYKAYVVGGAVRDLLLGLRPKDFDVATDATPEQVKQLFRRAFIIGRRFRIVHVVFGRGREHEVIEVSTFRAYMDASQAEAVEGNEKSSRSELAGMKHAVDASGRVLRDNVWGPQEEDAARRDFTVNAMYYDPRTQMVVDYHHGIRDAQKRVLKLIGDPATRYREDPVRIIRAARFAAKLAALGFKLDPKTAKPLVEMKSLLAEVPQSRLFDEMLKLLQTGHGLATIEQLRALGLARGIYPLLDVVVERADQPFVKAALADTDRRVAEGKSVAPSFLLACVLWQDVRDAWQARLARREHLIPALHDAIDDVFNARIGDVSGRGKLASDMREIWTMQPRFDRRTGSGPRSLVEHLRFRAGFDFLRLRADVGEVDITLADWWQEFSQADDGAREDLLAQVRAEQTKTSRVHRAPAGAAAGGTPPGAPSAGGPPSPPASPPSRPRRDRPPAAGPDQDDTDDDDQGDMPGDTPGEATGGEEPARKRRRRRRRRTGGAGGGPGGGTGGGAGGGAGGDAGSPPPGG